MKARAQATRAAERVHRKDIHVHLLEGAVEGRPVAGVGMVTAIISTLTGIAVRRDVAMTGEERCAAACC